MIGIIFTGGTIGSTAGERYITTDSKKSYRLIEMYREQYGDDVEFITDSPYEILSENITCREYPLLAEAVKKMIDRGVKGVIVTHGSDTLQYSAAFLSYVIPQGSVPVYPREFRSRSVFLMSCSARILFKNVGNPFTFPSFWVMIRLIRKGGQPYGS